MTSVSDLSSLSFQEYAYYAKKHFGDHIVIKISGSEFLREDFSYLVESIHVLLKNSIKVFLVFGGGCQIDEHYTKNTGLYREKKNGMGITTAEVLKKGVLPAYTELIEKMNTVFCEVFTEYGVQVLSPENMMITRHEQREYGYVGNPCSFDFADSALLHILGFVGMDELGNPYNVNADEIVSVLSSLHPITEVLFITKTGGILDYEDQVIPHLDIHDLNALVQGKYPYGVVSGGMKKKCQEIIELLSCVPKVAIANGQTLPSEFFSGTGAGTVCTSV